MRPLLFVAIVALIGCGGGTTGTGTGGSGAAGGTTGAAGNTGAAGTEGDAGTSGAAGTSGNAGTTGTGGDGGAGGGGGGRGGGTAGTTGAGGRGGSTAGTTGTGGRGGNAGTTGAGGRGGTTGTGGTTGAGGATSTCKRGIAANTAPGAAFYPAVRWWYNWSLSKSGGNTGIEFVPMIWGSSVNGNIPAGSKYLLGFNEPNFKAQSNLTPEAAASAWPALQTNARNAGALIVGPGLNFCGPAASCNGTDPYVYLTDFLAACTNCQVDHIAIHWYDNFPSLRAYIESNASLAGWEQFGKPIWLTEFSLNGSATAAQQEAFMREAIPYLEGHPSVFRYSWFSADPIPNAKLINSDGSPTALGQVYISLASTCQ